MPRGLGDIPSLRLERLQKFVTKFSAQFTLKLANMFPSQDSPSSTIEWESQDGTREMAKFKPPGAPTEQSAPLGVAPHSAEAAFWGDKMFFDEEFLNNVRKAGTESQYLKAKQRLSRELANMTSRVLRRQEWMTARMLFAGEFAYEVAEGVKATVDYDIPSDHIVSLSSESLWSTGNKKDIMGDVTDAKERVSLDCGGKVNWAVCNTSVFKYLATDTTIQTLLQKSTFGEGTLFKGAVEKLTGVNPKPIAALLDIDNFLIYDEQYEVRTFLTANVTGGTTTVIYVGNAQDFLAGGTLRFVNMSTGAKEDETIASVDVEAGTVTVSTAPTASFRAGRDIVFMRRKFIEDDKIVFFADNVENQPIAEYWKAPFGLDRHYGVKPDRWEKKDPDGIYLRVENKGLPVLYFTDAVYILTVA